jgi:hypothetical protein
MPGAATTVCAEEFRTTQTVPIADAIEALLTNRTAPKSFQSKCARLGSGNRGLGGSVSVCLAIRAISSTAAS